MTNTGIITEIKDNKAKIKVVRSSACGSNCQSCGGCELKDHFIIADIKTEFDYSPKVGDKVIINLDNRTFYLYTVLGYTLFVAFLILGGVLGYMKFKTEDSSVIGAFIGLAAGFFVLKVFFRNKKTAYKIQKSEN